MKAKDKLRACSWNLSAMGALMLGVSTVAVLAAEPNGVVPAEKIHEEVAPPLTRSALGPKKETRSGYQMAATRGAGDTRSLAQVEVVVEAGARASLSSIQFKLNSSSELANDTAKAQLVELVKALKMSPGNRYLIEGHTCSIGTDEVNNRLSAERAAYVRNELVKAGVPAASLEAIGCGAAEPHKEDVTPGDGEAALAPYRKVMIHKIASN